MNTDTNNRRPWQTRQLLAKPAFGSVACPSNGTAAFQCSRISHVPLSEGTIKAQATAQIPSVTPSLKS